MRLIVTLLFSTMVASTAFGEETKFDLQCKGVSTDVTSKPGSDWSVNLRVDLDANAWCSDACTAVGHIQAVQPYKIIFVEEFSPISILHGGRTAHIVVDRSTGKIEWFNFISGDAPNGVRNFGDCTSTKFSGLPKAKF